MIYDGAWLHLMCKEKVWFCGIGELQIIFLWKISILQLLHSVGEDELIAFLQNQKRAFKQIKLYVYWKLFIKRKKFVNCYIYIYIKCERWLCLLPFTNFLNFLPDNKKEKKKMCLLNISIPIKNQVFVTKIITKTILIKIVNFKMRFSNIF